MSGSGVKVGGLVTDLQEYLAAYGHLVALRQGDLDFKHGDVVRTAEFTVVAGEHP